MSGDFFDVANVTPLMLSAFCYAASAAGEARRVSTSERSRAAAAVIVRVSLPAAVRPQMRSALP